MHIVYNTYRDIMETETLLKRDEFQGDILIFVSPLTCSITYELNFITSMHFYPITFMDLKQ